MARGAFRTPSRRELVGGALGVSLVGMAARAQDGPVVAPIRVIGRRVTIQARIAGSDPVTFAIDTGAGLSTIDVAYAKTIPQLIFKQNINFGGLGGIGLAPVYDAPEVILGERIRQQHVVLVGTRPIDRLARGLFASGLLTTHDSELDFESEELRIWPRDRPGRPEGAPAETVLEDVRRNGASSRITAYAELDGRRGRFLLDTGAPRTMLLSPRAVERWNLWRDDQPYAPVSTAGFGGRDRRLDRMVRAGSLKIGETVIDRPLVTLHAPGDSDLDTYDGLIGLEVLQLLNLSFDRKSGSVWFKRNGLKPEPAGYSRSGVWLDQDGGRVRVAEVGFGSPGAEAGLKRGDIVVTPGDFATALRTISGANGPATLEVLRGGERRSVTLQFHQWL